MSERVTINCYRSRDIDVFTAHGRDPLDERSSTTRTETGTQVSTVEPKCEAGPRRHTDEDKVADRDRAVRANDLPETEGIARGRIHAQATQPAKPGNAGDGAQAESQRGHRASRSHFMAIPRLWTWRWLSTRFAASADCF